MKTKLQALISEQKALTARFEELVNKTTAKPYAFIGNEAKAEAIQSFLGAKSACFDSNSIYLNINGECSEFAIVPAFMPMIAQFYTIINLNEQPYFFEELNNTDPKKVYIKGHPTRGAEVIKMLEDLGGVNRLKVEGRYSESNYCLDTDYTIIALNQKNNDFSDYIELHLPEEIKVGDWCLLDEPCLKCELSDRMMAEPFVIDKISTPFDSDIAIVKFADGTQCELYKLRDKFHKVEPPTEAVELIEGEVYENEDGCVWIHEHLDVSDSSSISICGLDNKGNLHLQGWFSLGGLKKSDKTELLFDIIKDNNKYFDKENMRLLDVEEWSCEQGLPIIVRNETTNWRVDIFHSYDAVDVKYPYCCNSSDECDRLYRYAIPYTEDNLHLIGTTDNTEKHYKFVEK